MSGMYPNDECDRSPPRALLNLPPRPRISDGGQRRYSTSHGEDNRNRFPPDNEHRRNSVDYNEDHRYRLPQDDDHRRCSRSHNRDDGPRSPPEDRDRRYPTRYAEDQPQAYRLNREDSEFKSSSSNYQEEGEDLPMPRRSSRYTDQPLSSNPRDVRAPLSNAAQLERLQLEEATSGSKKEEAMRQRRLQRERAAEDEREAKMMAQIMKDSRQSARRDAERATRREVDTDIESILASTREEYQRKEEEDAARLVQMMANFGSGGGQGLHKSQTSPTSSDNSLPDRRRSINNSSEVNRRIDTRRRPNSMHIDTSSSRNRAPTISSPLTNVLNADSIIESPTELNSPNHLRRDNVPSRDKASSLSSSQGSSRQANRMPGLSTGTDRSDQSRRPREGRETPRNPQTSRPQTTDLPTEADSHQSNSIPVPRAVERVREELPRRASARNPSSRADDLQRSNSAPNSRPQPQSRSSPSLRESLGLSSRSQRRSQTSSTPSESDLAAEAAFAPRASDLEAARRESIRTGILRTLERADEGSTEYRAAITALGDLDAVKGIPEEDGLSDAFRPPSYNMIKKDKVVDHRKYTTDSVKENEAGGLKVIDEEVKRRMREWREVQKKMVVGAGVPKRTGKAPKPTGVPVEALRPAPIPTSRPVSASASASSSSAHVPRHRPEPSPASLDIADDIFATLTRVPIPRSRRGAPPPNNNSSLNSTANNTTTDRTPAPHRVPAPSSSSAMAAAVTQERRDGAARSREASRQALNAAFARIPRSESRGAPVPRISEHLGF